MVDTAIGPKIVPGVLRKALLSWYALMVMAIGVVLAGVGLFWYREEIAARYYEAQYKTLTALGLGIAPVVLWLSIFTCAMVM